MILLIDNYDSFTYNLAHLFGELGAEVVVRRNDEIDADEAERLAPTHLVVSPGPGRPENAGETPAILHRLMPHVPTLGVCLGHQAIVQAVGGEVGAAHELVHGKATMVTHDGRGIFAGLPEDFLAGRYHSLAATSVPDVFEVSATAPDGEVMAVRHRELPVDGVQFHPESVLTPHGRDIARNFLTPVGRRRGRTTGGHSALHGPGESGGSRGDTLSRTPAPPGGSERGPRP
jgi:anthranilate synthase/aminodeoxychorismate synthase-like glutamine amidotransferase